MFPPFEEYRHCLESRVFCVKDWEEKVQGEQGSRSHVARIERDAFVSNSWT